MPRKKRRLALVFAVSVAALASVTAIVPRQPRALMDANFLVSTPPAPESAMETTATTGGVPKAELAAPAEMSASVEASFVQAAAERNGVLKGELRWTFGGKQQRGWVIYVPLIQRLIDTDEAATTSGFAARLARWQKSVGLAGSGVLDEGALMRMISTWQGRRLKDRTYPQPAQLFTVPRAEFYDSSRADDLRQVERQTYAAYKRMVAAAAGESSLQLATKGGELAASEKYLKIISAFRSKEYQDRLRKQEPGAGRAALAVNSPHFTGRALDLYVGGEPTITKDSNRALQTETRAFRWLVKNAGRFGFCPYFYEPWHWEYCAP